MSSPSVDDLSLVRHLCDPRLTLSSTPVLSLAWSFLHFLSSQIFWLVGELQKIWSETKGNEHNIRLWPTVRWIGHRLTNTSSKDTNPIECQFLVCIRLVSLVGWNMRCICEAQWDVISQLTRNYVSCVLTVINSHVWGICYLSNVRQIPQTINDNREPTFRSHSSHVSHFGIWRLV